METTVDVLILGGGIGGLSTAHVLREQGFKGTITIIEQNSMIGGEARSDEWSDEKNCKYDNEHCWRIYGASYSYLFAIMKEIPISNTKNVYDNLVPLHPYIIAPKESQNVTMVRSQSLKSMLKYGKKPLKTMSISDKWDLLNKMLYMYGSSKERMYGQLSNKTWESYLDMPTTQMHDYFVRMVGPVFGVDLRKVSVSAIWEVVSGAAEAVSTPNSIPAVQVMNGPTNKAWFDHWFTHLQKRKVNILLNTQVIKIEKTSRALTSVTIHNANGKEVQVKAKWYILALPLQVVSRLISDSSLNRLAHLGAQYMIGVHIYFDEILTIQSAHHAGILMPDSPWALVIEPQGAIWKRKYLTNKTYKDVWSIGICDDTTPGFILGKSFLKCTREEVEEEVWYQIVHSSLTTQIQTTSGRNLHELQPIVHLFDSYQWCPMLKKLVTREVKTSPNAKTWELRPTTVYNDNTLFATSFTKTTREMILMDAAAEAGTKAAHWICKSVVHVSQPIHKETWLHFMTRPVRFVDKVLYKSGLDPFQGACAWIPFAFLLGALCFLAYLCWIFIRWFVKAVSHICTFAFPKSTTTFGHHVSSQP